MISEFLRRVAAVSGIVILAFMMSALGGLSNAAAVAAGFSGRSTTASS